MVSNVFIVSHGKWSQREYKAVEHAGKDKLRTWVQEAVRGLGARLRITSRTDLVYAGRTAGAAAT